MDCGKPQAKIGACLDTNHKLLLMGVLEASEGLRRTRCCTWLLLRKFCCSVVGTSKKIMDQTKMEVIHKVQ